MKKHADLSYSTIGNSTVFDAPRKLTVSDHRTPAHRPSMVHSPIRTESYRPFAFALTAAPNGQTGIHYGVLVALTNVLKFVENQTIAVDSEGGSTVKKWLCFKGTQGVENCTIHVPDNFIRKKGSLRVALLPWRGNVFLEWKTKSSGEITNVKLSGPATPTGTVIPAYDAETDTPPDDVTEYSYYTLIGNVSPMGQIAQNLSTDFYWQLTGINVDPEGSYITVHAPPTGGTGWVKLKLSETDTDPSKIVDWANGLVKNSDETIIDLTGMPPGEWLEVDVCIDGVPHTRKVWAQV